MGAQRHIGRSLRWVNVGAAICRPWADVPQSAPTVGDDGALRADMESAPTVRNAGAVIFAIIMPISEKPIDIGKMLVYLLS